MIFFYLAGWFCKTGRVCHKFSPPCHPCLLYSISGDLFLRWKYIFFFPIRMVNRFTFTRVTFPLKTEAGLYLSSRLAMVIVIRIATEQGFGTIWENRNREVKKRRINQHFDWPVKPNLFWWKFRTWSSFLDTFLQPWHLEFLHSIQSQGPHLQKYFLSWKISYYELADPHARTYVRR